MFIRTSALVLLCLFCSVFVYGQADEESRSWNQPVTPYRVIGNIYYVGATNVSSFLITTPRGHILLDSGFFETVPQIKQNVAKLGFKVSDIKILINSHAHYDHAGGLGALKELTRAKLLASKADAELMARGGKGDPHFGDRFLFPAVNADRIINDGERVRLGGTTLVAHLTPGHTKGCTTWTMKVTDGAKTYDVVFVGGTSAPGYRLIGNPQHPNVVEDYARTFRVLKSLPCDVFLTGHGTTFSMEEKAKLKLSDPASQPFIDRSGYRKFIELSETNFYEQLRIQQRKVAKAVYPDRVTALKTK